MIAYIWDFRRKRFRHNTQHCSWI